VISPSSNDGFADNAIKQLNSAVGVFVVGCFTNYINYQIIYKNNKKQGSIAIFFRLPQEKAILAPYRPVSIIEFWICLFRLEAILVASSRE
jgi:hypothetical protein